MYQRHAADAHAALGNPDRPVFRKSLQLRWGGGLADTECRQEKKRCRG